MSPKKKIKGYNRIYEKIERLYENYGIDTAAMDEEEFDRLILDYIKKPGKLDEDLEKSEKHKNKFSEDII